MTKGPSDFIDEHGAVVSKMKSLAPAISDFAKIVRITLQSGGKILICGNGGSAADSQHFAAELTGRYMKERRALAGIALSTDTSALTAIGNDYGFENVFSRQVEALGKKDDLLVLISTSGNSPNLLSAAKKANELGLTTFALLGKDGGKLKKIVQKYLVVPSDSTPRIQEMHIMVIHIVCEIVENEIFG